MHACAHRRGLRHNVMWHSRKKKASLHLTVYFQAAHTLNKSLMKAGKFNLRNWVSVRIIRINTAHHVALCLRAGHYVKANYMLSPFWEWVGGAGLLHQHRLNCIFSSCWWVNVRLFSGCTDFLHKAKEQSSLHQTAVTWEFKKKCKYYK